MKGKNMSDRELTDMLLEDLDCAIKRDEKEGWIEISVLEKELNVHEEQNRYEC